MTRLYKFLSAILILTAEVVSSPASAAVLTCTVPPNMPAGILATGGGAKVCPGDSRIYTVAAASDATSYNWVAPAGAVINAGQGTNSISITFDAGFTAAGTLSVTATNDCGTSPVRTSTISRNMPVTPSVIYGTAYGVCAGTTGTYSVDAVSGINFSWTAPAGASITAGQGTSNVTVSFSGAFATGLLKVAAYNGCATTGIRSLTINSVSPLPATIAVSGGVAKVCPGESRIYSIPVIPGATSYNWIAPAGAVIMSGQGTNTINVDFNSGFTASGTLSVAALNVCGTGAARSLTISRNTPATPSTIVGNANGVCPGTFEDFAVTPVSGMTYNWTAPAGASIYLGQGTSSPSVSFSGSFSSGALKVTAANGCATSAARSLTVYSSPLTPGTITGQGNNNCNKTTVNTIRKVAGAASYIWTTDIAGATIDVTPSPGDTMATIHYPAFTSGNLTVKASNGCGLSAARNLAVKGTLPAPSPISGSTVVSPCHDEIYSVQPLAGATSYLWSVPSGCSIISGLNTSTITVHFGTSGGIITAKGVNACGAGSASSLTFTVAVPVPSGMNTTGITTTGATFNWSAVTLAGSYNIQYRLAGALLWSPATSTTNSITISSLTPSSNYEWQVQSVCSSILSAFSSSSNFTTSTPACGTPTGLGSGSITTTAASLSWTAVSGAVSYNIQYRIVGAPSWITTTSGTNSKAISSLTPASNYEFQVQAVCSVNSGAFSSSANFTTLTPPCNTPIGLNATNVTTTSATLGWSAVSGAVSYDVQYRIVGALSWSPATSTATSVAISSLTPASNYEFQVKTVCAFSSGTYSASSNFTTLTPPCNTPTGLNASSITTTSATLGWTAVSGAVSYNIQYRLIGGSWSSTTSATNSKSLTGLTTGKTYEWQVQTACQFSNSAYSVSSSFTTTNTAVTIIRKAYLQMVSPTAVNIRWRTDIARTSRVRIGTTMGYGITVDSSTSTTEHEVRITGLSANTKYFYTIGSSTLDLQGDPNYFVKTALPAGNASAFRVWATGDFGKGSAGQDAVTTSFVNYTTTTTNTPADMWLWLGDNAYNAGLDSELTANVFSKYPNQLRNIPLYPCLGNHDYANVGYQSASALGTNFPYFNSFSCFTNAQGGGASSNTEKYYSFNYGNVHFITLDSYGALNASGSAMYNWLQADLIANTQRWTVVNWHHPPYSMGTHNSDTETEMKNMRNNIVPLLETYKVDLVLCGHSHTYERSVLLKGHFGLESTLTAGMKIDTGSGNAPYYQKSSPSFFGTVYAVVGVSGQGGAVSTQSSWPHAAMYSNFKTVFGSMIIDFNGDTLSAKFLTSTNTINDQFKIVKSGSSRFTESAFYNETLKEEDLVVYPNPFTHETMLRYNLREASPVILEIFDMTGSKVYSTGQLSKDAGVYEITLNNDLLNNRKGIFIVRLISNAGAFSKIIERVE